MAAVTVEDCLRVVPNRFELSLIASYRAKQLMNGSPSLYVPEKIEKNTVVALREIAADLLDIAKIKEDIKNNLKNQALFKSFDDSVTTYDTKKEDNLDVSVDASANEEEFDEDDVEDDEFEDDDEEYYNNLGNEESDDTFDEESDK